MNCRGTARRLIFPACLLAAIAALLVAASGAAAAERLYWGDYSASKTIGFAELDESDVGGSLEAPGAKIGTAEGIALDLAQDRVYYNNKKGISFVDLGGGPGGDLPLGVEPKILTGIALDPAAGVIYWSDGAANKLGFTRTDGSGGGYLGTGMATVDSPYGVAVDPGAGRLYWINNLAKSISYADLDGSGGGNLFASAEAGVFDNPQGLAIDPANDRVYWTNVYGQSIYSVGLDGKGVAPLNLIGANVSNPAGLAVDSERGRLYWGNVTSGKLSYANLDGSGGGIVKTGMAKTEGASYPNVLKPPVTAGKPQISGGAALSCSTGAWAADTPESFVYRTPSGYAYQWMLENAPIAGATGATFTPPAAGSYRCRVTGSNPIGSASETSDLFAYTPPPPPATPPVLSGLKVSPHTFFGVGAVAKASGARSAAAKRGATISFTLDRAATVSFAVAAKLPGRRAGDACVKPSAKNQGHARCSRLVSRGNFSAAAAGGADALRFSGKLGGRSLGAGGYRLTAAPSVGGLAGRPVTASFAVKLKPPQR